MSYNNVALGVILIIVLLIAIPLNTILIIHLVKIAKKKRLAGRQDYAISDRMMISLFTSTLFQTCFSCPIVIAIAFGNNNNTYSCNFTAFPVFALANAHIMHIVFLSIHRILLLSHPLLARKLNESFITSVAVCGVAWILGFLIALPPLFGFSSYTRIVDTCTIDWKGKKISNYIYISFCFFISFIIPVGVLLINFRNIGFVKNHMLINTQDKGEASPKIRSSLIKTSEETTSSLYNDSGNTTPSAITIIASNVSNCRTCREAILFRYSCIIMMAAFVGVWLPYACFSLLITLGVYVDDYIYAYSSVFGKSSMLVIPLAYALVYRKQCKLTLF